MNVGNREKFSRGSLNYWSKVGSDGNNKNRDFELDLNELSLSTYIYISIIKLNLIRNNNKILKLIITFK